MADKVEPKFVDTTAAEQGKAQRPVAEETGRESRRRLRRRLRKVHWFW